MATLTTTTTIRGTLNGQSFNITLPTSISGVTYYVNRSAKLAANFGMQTLNDTSMIPPLMTNADIVYARFDSLKGTSEGPCDVVLDTVGVTSQGRLQLSPGHWSEFFRADAGGIFAENTTPTTSALEVALRIEQGATVVPTLAALIVAFKPIS